MKGEERLKLRYVNELGEYVYIGNDRPFIYLSHTGLDSIAASPMLLKSPYQYGKSCVGNNIDERIVTISAALISETEEESENLRRELLLAFNPMISGRLEIIGNTYIRAAYDTWVVSSPKFKDEDYKDFQSILYWQVNICIPGAFLSDLDDTVFELSEVIPLFEFPFCVNINATFELGTLNKGGVKYNNLSDCDTPLIIEIFGPVQTPKISNLTTGEFIQVHTPILENERMIINTSFSNKRVTIIDELGQEKNAFHYIDLDSTFFSLRKGLNHVDFDAEAGNDTARVNVYFKRLWVGI